LAGRRELGKIRAMRLDLFLKKTCVVRQRSVAKQICDAGAARLNGQPAKAAQEVRAGDRIHLLLGRRELELRVVAIPGGNVARRESARFVEVLRDVPRDPAGEVFEEPGG
jgi:ribosomal 50S subunit-recycling heat shock protein